MSLNAKNAGGGRSVHAAKLLVDAAPPVNGQIEPCTANGTLLAALAPLDHFTLCAWDYVQPVTGIVRQMVKLTSYTTYSEYGCASRNELLVSSGYTQESCEKYCTDRTDCVSYEFTASSGTCQVSSSCTRGIATSSTPGSILVTKLQNPPTYTTYSEYGCASRNELLVSNGYTQESCEKYCTDRTDCVSYEFKASSGTCQASSSCTQGIASCCDTGRVLVTKEDMGPAIFEGQAPHGELLSVANLPRPLECGTTVRIEVTAISGTEINAATVVRKVEVDCGVPPGGSLQWENVSWVGRGWNDLGAGQYVTHPTICLTSDVGAWRATASASVDDPLTALQSRSYKLRSTDGSETPWQGNGTLRQTTFNIGSLALAPASHWAWVQTCNVLDECSPETRSMRALARVGTAPSLVSVALISNKHGYLNDTTRVSGEWSFTDNSSALVSLVHQVHILTILTILTPFAIPIFAALAIPTTVSTVLISPSL